MADLQNDLTLYLPFDESNGSQIAYDYSSNRKDGVVDKASFVTGRIGNCVRFDGTGSVEVSTQVINFSSDFTISALVRGAEATGGNTASKMFGWLVVWSGVNNFREKWIGISPGVWTHLVLVKIGRYLRYYVNGVLFDEDTILEGVIQGVSLNQDFYGTDLGKGDLDEFQSFGIALNQEQILTLFDASSRLEYYLDGENFKAYGIRVSSSEGITDGLKMKTPFSVAWDGEHGETVDLSRPRFEPREITLNCYIKTSGGKVEFINKVTQFLSLLRGSGTHRLMIDINQTKPLVYEVYCPNAIAISKTWNDDIMVGSFAIKVREPEPVKRVMKHIVITEATRTIKVAIKSAKFFNIHWGDGSHTYDVGGDSETLTTITHTYAENGDYFPIVTGVIEDIKEFTTNAIVVWNIL